MKDNETAPKTLTKRFTVDEANAMLPLVKSIVSDIQAAFRSVTGRRSVIRRLLRPSSRGAGTQYDDEVAESKADLQQEFDRIGQFRDELESLGILLRKPEDGCIEFPTLIGGREAFLTWELGEGEIRYYREANSSTSDRLPLPAITK